MKTDDNNLRSRRCCGDNNSEHDIEMNLSFEDFSERIIEDVDDDKKSRKHQSRSAVGCAVSFVGVCALLFFAATKTLNAAEHSVTSRTNVPPVQRYPSIHSTTARRF